MKNVLIVIIAVVVVIGIWNKYRAIFTPLGGECSIPYSCWHKIKFGDNELRLYVMWTDESRERGLSGFPSLENDRGMLFVFEKPDYYGIWMKDMNFPIDIIWLDEDMRAVDVKEGAEPLSYPEVFKPTDLAMYVLETNAGFVKNAKIKIGDQAKILK